MTNHAHDNTNAARRGLAGWTIWLAGLVVALGAAVATAHGLYVVALAAGAPQPIAWLYPLITDGLALVAYAASARLTGRGRRYAWTVVVLAAGLSGLAQASYLAGGVSVAPTELRFGVGAWPAVAAAIVAHLLFLLGTTRTNGSVQDASHAGVQPEAVQRVQPDTVQGVQLGAVQRVQPVGEHGVQRAPSTGVQPEAVRRVQGIQVPAQLLQVAAQRPSARELAVLVATSHADTAGELPTARELATLAGVSRGTAATALQGLRDQQGTEALITKTPEPSTTS